MHMEFLWRSRSRSFKNRGVGVEVGSFKNRGVGAGVGVGAFVYRVHSPACLAHTETVDVLVLGYMHILTL
jgi:hypothetical protein